MTERGQAGHTFEGMVRNAMAANGVATLEALADVTRIERGRWYRWFAGKSIPRPSTLRRATGVLGLSLDQLTQPWLAFMDGESPEPEPTLASALASLTDELMALRLEREAWTRGVVEVLRSYEGGRVPVTLLDALVPRHPEAARP